MVVPISGDQNYLPMERAKRITRRGADTEKVSFEDYLIEKVEPFDEGSDPGDGKQNGRWSTQTHPEEDAPEKKQSEESHGGDESEKRLPGRRIDLKA